MTTQKQVREAFWETFKYESWASLRRATKRQNEYPADVRVAFVDYVDALNKSGLISDALAERVTL